MGVSLSDDSGSSSFIHEEAKLPKNLALVKCVKIFKFENGFLEKVVNLTQAQRINLIKLIKLGKLMIFEHFIIVVLVI